MAPATHAPRASDIEPHRAYLIAYALAQLRERELAEECVQEALVAALEALHGFRGDSSLRTWLTSILRFKIADAQRRLVRDREVFAPAPEEPADEAWYDSLFDETGHWAERPARWGDPEAALESSRFWEAFERCLGRLPEQGRRVFFLREVLGEETRTICAAEGITESNCWVMLHRVRHALRDCLGASWFAMDGANG